MATAVVALIWLFITAGSTYANTASNATAADDTATKVICNVIVFVQKLGLPIMTGVILGSSIMAIFGRLAWPAIVMLVVFTAIFFGAGKLMAKFAAGLGSEIGNASTFECKGGGQTGTTN
ncbi:TrbC/VirB2 family protein [Anaplasma ovis]|uniref:TrbC/VirB2 family protein n=1 Tax=Anaplasma ovis TaxID=142058 RepID=UPI000947916A|nr:TrbC/VirB2 family protein [Anaplasma ovis]